MKQCRMVALVGATVLAVQVVPSFAQSTAPVSAETLAAQQDQLQARYQVFVMEGVLERAVQHGGQLLSRRVQAVMPDMLLLAGAARARGFRLEGYGVFFDVEVPALRRSMAWSFRMLDQNGPGLASAVESLRRHVQTVGDPQARQDLEQALEPPRATGRSAHAARRECHAVRDGRVRWPRTIGDGRLRQRPGGARLPVVASRASPPARGSW